MNPHFRIHFRKKGTSIASAIVEINYLYGRTYAKSVLVKWAKDSADVDRINSGQDIVLEYSLERTAWHSDSEVAADKEHPLQPDEEYIEISFKELFLSAAKE